MVSAGAGKGTVTGVGKVGLGTGVLGPLYLVAMRCRDRVVRREAVRLPGGEGLWDSRLFARAAERVVGIEGGCGVRGRGGDRVAGVDVMFDPEGRRAGVTLLLEDGGVVVRG